MVFCCIAIVAVAIMYFFGLWIRQVFSWPRRDRSVSDLPAPPRALSGNGALPVYGHTRLFARLAGDVALLFPPTWREFPLVPARWSRPLGHCFAIFIWGKWRIVVKGPERAQRIMESMELKEGWPWTPPEMLLGKSCFSFLSESEADQLRLLIGRPLAHRVAVQYAIVFAELAEKCLDDIRAGTFTRSSPIKQRSRPSASEREAAESPFSEVEQGSADFDDDTFASGPSHEVFLKVKWEALRSYTLDLMDGPILGMHKWAPRATQAIGESTRETGSPNPPQESRPNSKQLAPSRSQMLMWMERMKRGIDVIKTTFGPEWMYIWLLNEYGRALNARTHLQDVLRKHVEAVAKTVPVRHARGHSYYDPATRPIPLLTMRENAMRNKENIFGGLVVANSTPSRPRSQSMPMSSKEQLMESGDEHSEYNPSLDVVEYVRPYYTEQDLIRPRYERSPVRPGPGKHLRSPPPPQSHSTPPRRVAAEALLERPPASSPQVSKPPKPLISILERILLEQDLEGLGITQVVTTEISIILWLMMEVGNAWTAMALNLLSTDKEACRLVQEELDVLEREHGHTALFSPAVLGRMRYLDALLYEAIRLTPANLGGMKMTTQTVEFADLGVQIPKNSHILFCQASNMKFDIEKALGHKPELLGSRYPCVELHGFLPLQGLEVPLMVLQSKVFLICVLQKYSPFLCKKNTLIRRVSQHLQRSAEKTRPSTSTPSRPASEISILSQTVDDEDEAHSAMEANTKETPCSVEMTQSEALRLFTKIPFPEPKRIIKLRPRVME
jgi:hypothetical protein